MTSKRILLSPAIACAPFTIQAQNLTPMNLRSLPMDFPGLKNDYNLTVIDANFASSGPVNRGLLETIDVDLDAANMITTTGSSSTLPINPDRATGSMSGNVYTSLAARKMGGVWKPCQRETVYTEGTLDTAFNIEAIDSLTPTYVNTERRRVSYASGSQPAEIMRYTWSSGAWTPRYRRVFSHSGSQYSYDSLCQFTNGNREPTQHNICYYAGGRLDSVAIFKNMSGSFQPGGAYKMALSSTGKTDTTYSLNPDASGGWKYSSRVIFTNGIMEVRDVPSAPVVSGFPVPAHKVLNIAPGGKAFRSAAITLRAGDGRVVFHQEIHESVTTIDISEIPSGNYWVTVSTVGLGIVSKLIVIQH